MAFAMFDLDGDGIISTSEVMQVMKKLGIKAGSSEIQSMVNKVDLDGA